MMQTRMLINGELVAGQGAPIDVIDPATGETVAQVNEASNEQVDAAVAGSSEAFETGKAKHAC